jgi:hypothetical protein
VSENIGVIPQSCAENCPKHGLDLKHLRTKSST